MPCSPFSHAFSIGRSGLLFSTLLAAAPACSGDGLPGGQATKLDPLRITVLMASPHEGGLPNLEWAVANVNAAGGVAGRDLALDYMDPPLEGLAALGEELADDDAHVAVIGLGSAGLLEVAGSFVSHRKPIVSPLSTSDDLLRAYGGKGAVWRTRESDIAQTELLVRFAMQSGAKRVTLLSSLGVGGYTFFSWFGFFASELGLPDANVNIVELAEKQPCEVKLVKAMSTMPDMLFVAPGNPEEMKCVVENLPPPGMPRPRVVFADTGLDPYALETMGPAANGVEGFMGGGDEAYKPAFSERFQGARFAPHGENEYDAVLLLAYGLELSGGRGGTVLIDAMQEAVDGAAEGSAGWDATGITSNLAALRAGQRPLLRGATGPLTFEPGLYMDLEASTLSHWKMNAGALHVDGSFYTGDPTFLTSKGTFVKPGLNPKSVDDSSWVPLTSKTDTWAVIAALSSSWSNYRHQSDAIQQYKMLRANGVEDDHIVLIMADDIAASPENNLPGVVRNEPTGVDLYEDIKIDYNLSPTTDDLTRIITGQVTATTPSVIMPTASSNVYIYLVGHGGTGGIPMAANTPGEGLSGGGATFSPTNLREALCAMQADKRYRRVLAVIESCYSGAFGDATYDGIERGCVVQGADVPLEGVVLFTAANSKEVSFAGAFDDEVDAWVNDAFSRVYAVNALRAPEISLADLYTDVYRATAGSHPSIFNADYAGRLTMVPFVEFVTP